MFALEARANSARNGMHRIAKAAYAVERIAGQFSERLCCRHGGLPSSFDRLPPRLRNPEADDLDRLVASRHALTRCYRKPGADKASDHVAIKQLRPALLALLPTLRPFRPVGGHRRGVPADERFCD